MDDRLCQRFGPEASAAIILPQLGNDERRSTRAPLILCEPAPDSMSPAVIGADWQGEPGPIWGTLLDSSILRGRAGRERWL